MRAVAVVAVVALAVWTVLALMQRSRASDAQNSARVGSDTGATSVTSPSTGAAGPNTSAPVGAEATSAGATVPAPPTGSPVSASPRPTEWTAQGAAAAMVAEFDATRADADALVFMGPFGEKVDNSPVVVSGRWGTARLRNGLTVAANHARALRAGKLEASSPLPTATTTASITVSANDVRRLPVQSARDAFAGLTDTDGPACTTCRPIVVTGVTSTTMRVSTTEGRVVVPAYSYAVQGTKARLVAPALAPSALVNPFPTYRGAVGKEVERGMLPLWRTSLARDGRTFTAFVDTRLMRGRGGCWRLFAVESDKAAAVYAAPGKADAVAPCATRGGKVTIRLVRPLADRTLLDTYWARAIAP